MTNKKLNLDNKVVNNEITSPEVDTTNEKQEVVEKTTTNLSENLEKTKYPEIILSQPDENSPKIRTYFKNNSSFADKGTCCSDVTKTLSVQDLVLLTIDYYCSPDWRNHRRRILNIDLFPKENDLPDEYDNTESNKYGSGTYDYLVHNKENDKIFEYWEWDQLSWKKNYFRVSPDDTVLLPDIETVEPCNWWYFHHIVIDNKCWYKTVDGKTIQEVINGLIDQKREKERVAEYREKNGDIWIELPFTEYYQWWYETKVYMWDAHWTPAHEHTNETRTTNKILVKYWKPGDSINFYYWDWFYKWARYTLSIDENKKIDIYIHTGHSRNNQQKWWYVELKDSNIQKWQIFINGVDVYESTIARLSEYKKEQKEKRNTAFAELKELFINEANFSEDEFKELTKYPWKWWILWFLSIVKTMLMLTGDSTRITKEELFDWIKDIKNIDKKYFSEITKKMTGFEIYSMNSFILRNYILLKKNKEAIKYSVAKRVVDKAHAWQYLYDSMPWITLVGDFNDSILALRIALDNWLFGKEKKESNNNDLWIKLKKALEEKKKNKKDNN